MPQATGGLWSPGWSLDEVASAGFLRQSACMDLRDVSPVVVGWTDELP